MGNHSNSGWSRRGYAADDDASLTTSYLAVAVGTNSAVARSSGFPDDCHIYDVTFELSAMPTSSGIPTKLTFYIARDSGGTQPLTPVYEVDIVKALGAVAATGGAYQRVEAEVWSDDYTGPLERGDLYVVAKVDVGTATAETRVKWRS
ncbi:MAG: hypothetical protein P1V36_00230 [Planctomycetota bacterium]|nr:hypothetical protein [Planctomycetota bacterium]